MLCHTYIACLVISDMQHVYCTAQGESLNIIHADLTFLHG